MRISSRCSSTSRGRKFLIAGLQGGAAASWCSEDDCVGNTRKGKQVLNVGRAGHEALAVVTVVSGDTVAVIGENRKMLMFQLSTRCRRWRVAAACACRSYKDGGLSDIKRRSMLEDGPHVEGLGRTRPGA
jgi:topoisomerase-4 subunit A